MPNKPIFFDETGRRRQRLSILGWTGAVLSTILGVAVLVSIVATRNAQSPDLPIHLKAISAIEKKLERKAVDPALVKSAVQLAREARTREKLIQHWKQAEANRPSPPLSAALKPRAEKPLTIGF
jgi:peptidoglycan-N-acetylglucosamine deacetylase